MNTANLEDYRAFCKPAELHKAVNMLRGLVAGISADGSASVEEIHELSNWVNLHANLRNRHPFTELIPAVEEALVDGVFTIEERQNILWLCENCAEGSPYYDVITSAVQYLSGMAHGLLADGELSDAEIKQLKAWLDNNDFLAGVYPYDELMSLTTYALADGQVSTDERNMLMAFISNLIEFKDSYNLIEPDFAALREKYSISGICAMCPDIVFERRAFCFTGESYKCSRAEFVDTVTRLGGVPRSGVSSKTNYLVVGNAGNPCWAFACYGRKIEEALHLRKKGMAIQIVNETDFWDAVADA